MINSADVTSLLVTVFEGAFYLTILIFIGFSLALAYHWYAYAADRKTAVKAMTIYLVGSAPLFLMMAISFIAL